MFNDTILKALKLLAVGTADANPLWRSGVMAGGMADNNPDTLEGRPYIINDEMASLGSGNKVMLFGDFKKFVIRETTDFILVRLNELYMANLNVGFVGYKRASSHLLNAGTNPIKYLACGTT
jgi:HK97 family phage major capsid protein